MEENKNYLAGLFNRKFTDEELTSMFALFKVKKHSEEDLINSIKEKLNINYDVGDIVVTANFSFELYRVVGFNLVNEFMLQIQ